MKRLLVLGAGTAPEQRVGAETTAADDHGDHRADHGGPRLPPLTGCAHSVPHWFPFLRCLAGAPADPRGSCGARVPPGRFGAPRRTPP